MPVSDSDSASSDQTEFIKALKQVEIYFHSNSFTPEHTRNMRRDGMKEEVQTTSA